MEPDPSTIDSTNIYGAATIAALVSAVISGFIAIFRARKEEGRKDSSTIAKQQQVIFDQQQTIIAGLTKRIEQLEKDLTGLGQRHDEQLNTLLTKCDLLLERNDDLQRKYDDLKEKYGALLDQHEACQEENKRLTNRVTQLEDEVGKLRGEIDEKSRLPFGWNSGS